MSLHLHCPNCGELLAEEGTIVTTSAREGTRQETFDLGCRCGTRLRLQLPPERLGPRRRRRSGRQRPRTNREETTVVEAERLPETPGAPPSAERPFPFTSWQYARLLMLRGRVQDGDVGEDGRAADAEESA